MKIKLLPKFIISLGILGVILTVVVSLYSYITTKGSLEELFADKIINGSKSISTMIDVDDVREIIAEGGDQTEAYERVTDILDTVKQDSEITYLSLVVPDEDSVTFYIDCCVEEMGDDPAAQIPYGSDVLYTDAASTEEDLQKYYASWDLYSQNKATDEPLVTDNSYGYNYTAVAPILDENGQAVAQIQYILDMQSVRDYLNHFLWNMLAISFIIVCVTLLMYAVAIRLIIIRPITKLDKFTTDIIKEGKFENRSIDIKTGDEIEELGNSFVLMIEKIENYIENLTKVTAEKERIGAELDVATHIQASMLPCIFPAFPGRDEIDIYATMTPAKEVGGDFYDFFMVDDSHVAIVMADVSGKGVPAALFMVIAKTLIKDHTFSGRNLGEVFSEVNNILCESNSNGMFVTAFEGVLDLKTGEFRYVNAGHEPPHIYRQGQGYELYKIKPGFVLAGIEDFVYKEETIQLNVGDRIFQYTDGVTEATNINSELYGMDRLNETLNKKCAGKTLKETLTILKDDIDEFVGEAEPFDDITMLCCEYVQKME